MHKKAQAAMEFLMTYGWAILVVLVAIGALAYFGVLNPARFLPASCTLMPGLGCTSFKVQEATTNTVTLNVQNGMGTQLEDVNFELSGDVSDGDCAGNTASTADLSDGATGQWTINCDTVPSAGDRFKSDITIYYTQGGVTHTRTGSITTEVES